jgi:hypothetical protein
MSKVAVTLAAGLVLAVSQAHALSPVQDVNRDGLYSLAEVQAGVPDVSQAVFDRADTNGDHVLSPSELSRGQAADHILAGIVSGDAGKQ